MAKKKKTRISLDQSEGFGGSLGAQLGLSVPKEYEAPAQVTAVSGASSVQNDVVFRIELRVSRKGYGGKTVTECRGIAVNDKASQAEVSRTLSKSLGVRVFWKSDVCCVQGDQVERLIPFFESQGHTVR